MYPWSFLLMFIITTLFTSLNTHSTSSQHPLNPPSQHPLSTHSFSTPSYHHHHRHHHHWRYRTVGILIRIPRRPSHTPRLHARHATPHDHTQTILRGTVLLGFSLIATVTALKILHLVSSPFHPLLTTLLLLFHHFILTLSTPFSLLGPTSLVHCHVRWSHWYLWKTPKNHRQFNVRCGQHTLLRHPVNTSVNASCLYTLHKGLSLYMTLSVDGRHHPAHPYPLLLST